MGRITQSGMRELAHKLEAFEQKANEALGNEEARCKADIAELARARDRAVAEADAACRETLTAAEKDGQKQLQGTQQFAASVLGKAQELERADEYYKIHKEQAAKRLTGVMTAPFTGGAEGFIVRFVDSAVADATKKAADRGAVAVDMSVQGADAVVKAAAGKGIEVVRIQKADFFESAGKAAAAEMLKELDRYEALCKKYSASGSSGFWGGMHYAFSSQRQQEYDEIIKLQNTLTMYAQWMKKNAQMMPSFQKDTAQRVCDGRKAMAAANYEQARQKRMAAYTAARAGLQKTLGVELDTLLPEDVLTDIRTLARRCESAPIGTQGCFSRIGTNVMMSAVLRWTCGDGPAAELFKKKLGGAASLALPICHTANNAFSWLLPMPRGGSDSRAFARAAMLGLLCTFLPGCLICTVADPVQKGGSIAPFQPLLAQNPELFGGGLCTDGEDIRARIAQLHERVVSVCTRIGKEYRTQIDYWKDHPDYRVPLYQLLVLFDVPVGLDAESLDRLGVILRDGWRAGVYTVLVESQGGCPPALRGGLEALRALAVPLQYDGAGRLQFSGVRGGYLAWAQPQAADYERFFRSTRIFADSGRTYFPLSRPLSVISRSSSVETLKKWLGAVCDTRRRLTEGYGRAPDAKTRFPADIPLGTALFPAHLFRINRQCGDLVQEFGAPDAGDGLLRLPLSFSFGSGFNLLLPCGAQREKITALTHRLLWAFLSFLPVSCVNICVFDAEQRGNSILPFLELRGRAPELFDRKIYTDAEAMHARLQQLSGQIDAFIQDKLGSRYKNILEYNNGTPSRPEPVTLLLLYDFPSGLDGRSLDLLAGILRNGPRCGVYTLLCHNPAVPVSRYDNIEEHLARIRPFCVTMAYENGAYVLPDYGLTVELPAEPDAARRTGFVEAYAAASEQARRQGISFDAIAPQTLFSRESAESLRIPVGLGDGDAVVEVTLGEGSSHHGLIAGATGSGKSTLLHTLILSAMLHYGPDQLQLYLMDFKSGTEFKVYETVPLPHIRLLALDTLQEFGESILESLVEEMERRGAQFKEAGQTGLRGYVRATGKPLPRILVVMDEFQILFNDAANRKVALNCAQLAKRIVTEGRAFGIHLLMATQSTRAIADLTLSKGTIEQMRVRVGLKCSEDDARYLFSDTHDRQALEMMKGPIGTAVLNPDYTEKENVGFRTAFCDKKSMQAYLETISRACAQYPCALQVFEGGRTVRLLDYFAEAGIGFSAQRVPVIHIGELIRVAPPFTISADRRRKHNLLVCGADEKMEKNLAENYMISAFLNENARVWCIDGDQIVGDELSGELYDALAGADGRFRAAHAMGDVLRFVNDVYERYTKRKKQGGNETDFVIIRNLQYLDLVKSMLRGEQIDESEYLDEAPGEPQAPAAADPFAAVNSLFSGRSGDGQNVSDKLLTMIGSGTAFGVHFVVTSLDYQTVRETMHYGENALSRFPERAIFSLGDADAANLIDSVSASGLSPNTIYFTDGVTGGFQVRPYTAPAPADLRAYLDKAAAQPAQ